MNTLDLCSLLLETLHTKQPNNLEDQMMVEGHACQQLYTELLEMRRFVMELAAGDLSSTAVSKGYTAGALKSLHANLKHMTWQTQMIAAGDFTQRLDFMGEFSRAFNAMTEQLEESVRVIKKKEEELQRANSELQREIEGRINAQKALMKSETHYRNLTETMKDVVWVLDSETLRFTYVSPSVERLRGFTPEEVMAHPLDAALTPAGAKEIAQQIHVRRQDLLRGVIDEATYFTSEVEQPHKDGSAIWTEVIVRFVHNKKNNIVEIHGVTRDISERRALNLQLEHQATTDSLTEVATRGYFLSTAQKEILRSQRHNHTLSLLMLDIDHFKKVNDSFGHAVGDIALRAVATTCRDVLRSSDLMGRIGGEEFALLLVETPFENAWTVAERLRTQIAALVLYADQGQIVSLTVSIGLAEHRTADEETLSDLMLRADRALYQAKNSGRNRVIQG